MKKITYLTFCLVFLTFIGGCTGYKPIFGTSNLKFEIAEYSIEGNKELGKKIYSKLYNLSNSSFVLQKKTNISLPDKPYS